MIPLEIKVLILGALVLVCLDYFKKKKGYKCLSCDTTLTMDYRNKFDDNYCGDC